MTCGRLRTGWTAPGAMLALLLGLAVPALAQGPAEAPSPPQAGAQKQAGKAGSPPVAGPEGVVKRRDPFRSLLLGPQETAEGKELPPGKRGLVISQLTVNGIVAGTTQMIAVVTMSGRDRAYFLREGDEVYEGRVDQITPDAVVFKQRAEDAFGNKYEKEVVKPLSGSGA